LLRFSALGGLYSETQAASLLLFAQMPASYLREQIQTTGWGGDPKHCALPPQTFVLNISLQSASPVQTHAEPSQLKAKLAVARSLIALTLISC